MKKYLVFLLILLCVPAWSSELSTNYDPRMRNLSGVTDTTTARTNLDVYSKAQSEALAASGELLYYCTNATSPAVPVRFATTSADLSLATEVTSATANVGAAAVDVYTLVKQTLTPAGYPGITNLRPGLYVGQFYAGRAGTGNKVIHLEMELWKTDSNGANATFIATSTEELLPTTADTVQYTFALASNTTMLVTDRILVKRFYEVVSGTGNNTIEFTVGGSKLSYFGIPVSRDFVVTLNSPQSLTNKTLDGTNTFNGSSTQNFNVATLTPGNIGGMTLVRTHLAGGGQTMTSTSTPALILWDTEDYDTNNEQLGATFTAKTSGVYLVSADIGIQSAAVTTFLYAAVYKNNVLVSANYQDYGATGHAAPSVQSVNLCTVVRLSVGDTITIKTAENSAGSGYIIPSSTNWFEITRIQ